MKLKISKLQFFPLLSALALSPAPGSAAAPISRGSMLPIVTGVVGPGFHRDIGDNQADLAFLWHPTCTLFSGKHAGAMKDRPWQAQWLLGVGGHDLMGTRQLSGLVGLFVHSSALEASLHYQPLFSMEKTFQDQCGQALKKAAKRLEVKCRPQWHPLFPVISVLPISLFDTESYNLGVGWGVDLFSHLKVNLGIHLPTREVSFEHLANIYGGISLKIADKVPALWVTKSLSSQIRPVNRMAQGQSISTPSSANAAKGNHPLNLPQTTPTASKAPKRVNQKNVTQGTTPGLTPATAISSPSQGTATTNAKQGTTPGSTPATAIPSPSQGTATTNAKQGTTSGSTPATAISSPSQGTAAPGSNLSGGISTSGLIKEALTEFKEDMAQLRDSLREIEADKDPKLQKIAKTLAEELKRDGQSWLKKGADLSLLNATIQTILSDSSIIKASELFSNIMEQVEGMHQNAQSHNEKLWLERECRAIVNKLRRLLSSLKCLSSLALLDEVFRTIGERVDKGEIQVANQASEISSQTKMMLNLLKQHLPAHYKKNVGIQHLIAWIETEKSPLPTSSEKYLEKMVYLKATLSALKAKKRSEDELEAALRENLTCETLFYHLWSNVWRKGRIHNYEEETFKGVKKFLGLSKDEPETLSQVKDLADCILEGDRGVRYFEFLAIGPVLSELSEQKTPASSFKEAFIRKYSEILKVNKRYFDEAKGLVIRAHDIYTNRASMKNNPKQLFDQTEKIRKEILAKQTRYLEELVTLCRNRAHIQKFLSEKKTSAGVVFKNAFNDANVIIGEAEKLIKSSHKKK